MSSLDDIMDSRSELYEKNFICMKAMDPFETGKRRILSLVMNRAQIYISQTQAGALSVLAIQASSSNGRAPDSKSGCWGFESLLACHDNRGLQASSL